MIKQFQTLHKDWSIVSEQYHPQEHNLYVSDNKNNEENIYRYQEKVN